MQSSYLIELCLACVSQFVVESSDQKCCELSFPFHLNVDFASYHWILIFFYSNDLERSAFHVLFSLAYRPMILSLADVQKLEHPLLGLLLPAGFDLSEILKTDATLMDLLTWNASSPSFEQLFLVHAIVCRLVQNHALMMITTLALSSHQQWDRFVLAPLLLLFPISVSFSLEHCSVFLQKLYFFCTVFRRCFLPNHQLGFAKR